MLEKIELGNFVAKIYNDEEPQNPRTEWDNLCTMIMKSNRYNLGDENQTAIMDDCESWDEVETEILKKFGRDCIILPIYIYDHSGITISTTPFSCRWDSGRVGTIVVSRETARKELGFKRITEERRKKIVSYLEGEVETYDQYLRGDVYGYQIVEVMVDDDGDSYEEDKDSCWGFYGLDYMKEEVNQILKGLDAEQKKVMGEQIELKLA